MGSLKCVVFDLDDTLHLEVKYVQSGFHAVARGIASQPEQVQQFFDHMWQQFHSGNKSHVFNSLLSHHGMVRHTVDDLIHLYRNHLPAIKLDREAVELLEWIKEKGLSTALISDGHLSTQMLKVQVLELAGYIDLIVLTDQWGREFWKPHERAFREVESKFGFDAGSFVYIADNVIKDFRTPNLLGWHTIQYINPEQVYRDCTASSLNTQAHHIAESLDEIRQYIACWL